MLQHDESFIIFFPNYNCICQLLNKNLAPPPQKTNPENKNRHNANIWGSRVSRMCFVIETKEMYV